MRNIEELRDLLEEKEAERDNLENELSMIDDDIYSKEKCINDLKIDLTHEEYELEDLQNEFDDVELQIDLLNDEIYDLETEIEELESEEM